MIAVVELDVGGRDRRLDPDLHGRVGGDARDLLVRLGRLGRAVDAEHPSRSAALLLEVAEARDHAGLRAAGHRVHDDRVEEDPQRALLLGDLEGPAREAEAAERWSEAPAGIA